MQRSLTRSFAVVVILIVAPFSVLASASPYAPGSASLSESALTTATLTPTPANVFYIGQTVPGLTVQHDGCGWTCSQNLSVTYTGSGNVAGFVVRERAVMTNEGAPPWDDTWIRGFPFGSYGGGVIHGEGWRENCYSNGYPGYTRVDVCSSAGYGFRDGIVQSEVLASGGSTVNMVFSVTGHPANVGYYEVAEIRVIYYGIPPTPTPTATPAVTETPTATSTPVSTETPISTPTTPLVSISITDSQSNPIPNNALALNSIGRLDPISATLTVNNTGSGPQPVSFTFGGETGIAQFTVTPDASTSGCTTVTTSLSLLIVTCEVQPGETTLTWQVQFHPSDADTVPLEAQIGTRSASTTLAVPKTVKPDAPYAGDYGPYGVGESEYQFAAGVDPDVDPTSTITTEVWARVWWPVDQLSGLMPPGRLPLVVMMHGMHGTCRFDFLTLHAETNDYAYTGTCLTRDLQGNPSSVGIPFSVLPNHEGYEYLAERLASWGYIVVSVNTNRGVNIPDRTLTTPGDRAQILARGRLLLKHLQLWQAWDATGTTPAEFGSLISADSMIGNRFQGKVDFDNVGLLGHSRGGEGVRAAYYLYQNDPQVDWLSRLPNLSIQGIFEIGPTDYGPELQEDDLPPLDASGTAWNVILPMCDGDMYMLPGERPFDRMMANLRVESPTTQKSVFAVWGANHNPYNTQWFRVTDLYKVVNGVGVNIDCTGDPANVLLNSGDQRETAIASVLAFFRGNVFSPAVKDNLFGADDPAFDATFNETFNPLFDETSASAITLLERSFTYSSALVVDIIEDFGNSTGFSSSGAANDASNIQIVHGSVPEHDASLQAGIIAWPVDANVSGINTYFQTNLATPQDARSFVSLDFRVARQDSLLNTLGTSTNFSIRLM